jgi:hypothetical protein
MQEAEKKLKEYHSEIDSLLQKIRDLKYKNMNSLDLEINKFFSKENGLEFLQVFLIKWRVKLKYLLNIKKIELINKNKLNKFCLKR